MITFDSVDYRFPVWAGILPLAIRSRQSIPDVELFADIVLPDYVVRYDTRLKSPTQVLDERAPNQRTI
jgi:hypothetical protein